MIVRIGDERKMEINDHLVKLKNKILSEETMSNHHDLTIDTLVASVSSLPHKTLLYAALTSLINKEDPKLTKEIIGKVQT